MINKRFIDPTSIYARIKEEMRSYFNTGAIDDLLFPIWTKDCIDKFEKTYYPLEVAVMDIFDHKCELPCDFKLVREAWVCATFFKGPVTSPHVFYYQTDCRINAAPFPAQSCSACLGGFQCFPPSQTPTEVALPNLCGVQDDFIVTHKVMTKFNFSYHVTGLLKPSNFKTLKHCHEHSINRECNAFDTFDIIDNKLITSFNHGTVHLLYYAEPKVLDENGYYAIPDNESFKKYVYYYIRYMIYQQLYDQSTDESLRIIKDKMKEAEAKSDAAFIRAKTYAISHDIYGTQQDIIRSYNRHNRFKIGGPNISY